MIRLSVPGSLLYRDLVLRVVESSCKLVQLPPEHVQEAGQRPPDDQFDTQVVSAFSEAFNNIAIHGYRGAAGEVCVEIEVEHDALIIRLMDHGVTFDPTREVPRQPPGLPEGGMGLFILHQFMDEIAYEPGSPPAVPNVLRLVKRRGRGARSGRAGVAPNNDSR
jgi:serine/threonine-protein kinase RsbW